MVTIPSTFLKLLQLDEIRPCPIEGFHPSQLKAAFCVFPCRGSPWWIFWVATLRCAVRDRRIASSTGPEGQKRIEKVLYKVGWRHPQSWLETPFETFFFWPNFCLCPFNGTLRSGEFGGFEPDSDYEKILEFAQIPPLPNFCWIWVVKLIGLLNWWESWELWVYYPKKHISQWIQLSIHSWDHGYIIQTETAWRYEAAPTIGIDCDKHASPYCNEHFSVVPFPTADRTWRWVFTTCFSEWVPGTSGSFCGFWSHVKRTSWRAKRPWMIPSNAKETI